jgi:hypothetical protein
MVRSTYFSYMRIFLCSILILGWFHGAIAQIDPVVPPSEAYLIDGYALPFSATAGTTTNLFLNSATPAEDANIAVHKTNNEIAGYLRTKLITQTTNWDNLYQKGYHYRPTAWAIPDSLKSGVYLINTTIPILIKNPKRDSKIVVVYPSNTVNAYNDAGGKSLYTQPDRSYIVSFDRPCYLNPFVAGFLTWAEQTKYKFDYISDMDLEDPANFDYADLVIFIGHSEYWTRKARENFDRYIDNGKDALILSGNVMWWQVRYSEDHREMICYKDSLLDPETNPLNKTVNWSKPYLQMPILNSVGADFPHGGYGLKQDNGWDGYKILNDKNPLLKDTGLKTGEIVVCPTGEYDGVPVIKKNNDLVEWDSSQLKFHKQEIIGFDLGTRLGEETVGTWIAFQKTPSSGIIVNMASRDWCSEVVFNGADEKRIKQITANAIDLLLSKQSVFSLEKEASKP